MLLIPSIDLVRGKVVRLTRGRLEGARVYFDDPVEAARKWAREGADALHVVDIEAAMGVGDNTKAIRRVLSAVDVEVQVAGGVRSLERARELVELGAARVVVGTRFVEDPQWLDQLVSELGGRRVMVALDHVGGMVAIRGWTRVTQLRVEELAKEAERRGAGWILLTSVERDGTLAGIDVGAVEGLAATVRVPIVVAGGVGGVEDVLSAARAGASGVILGKALYEGRLSLGEAARALERAGLR